MFTVASRFRRLKFVGSYLSTIEAVGTGSWLSVVQVLLDVSIALLVAIIEFHGGIQRGYRTISSEFFFVKRYMQDHLDRVSSWRKNLRLHWDPPKFFFQVEKSTTPIKKSFGLRKTRIFGFFSILQFLVSALEIPSRFRFRSGTLDFF